jgi:hypothetical protein
MTDCAPVTAVILTMPRSGSSLLAGVIHALGVPMGDEDGLRRGTHLNRFGCFEDQEVQFISLNILAEAGLLLDLSSRLEVDDDAVASATARYDRQIHGLVARHSGTTWGFKDPGLIYSLPHWHHQLENPRYIHLTRPTANAAASLVRTYRPSMWLPELRAKWSLLRPVNRARVILGGVRLMATGRRRRVDREVFERVIEDGHRRIGGFLGDTPRLEVELAELVSDSRAAISRIARFLGLDLDTEGEEAAAAFVHPELLQDNAPN